MRFTLYLFDIIELFSWFNRLSFRDYLRVKMQDKVWKSRCYASSWQNKSTLISSFKRTLIGVNIINRSVFCLTDFDITLRADTGVRNWSDIVSPLRSELLVHCGLVTVLVRTNRSRCSCTEPPVHLLVWSFKMLFFVHSEPCIASGPSS